MRLPWTNLTERDRDILDTLARRVRVLSVGQIAVEWFASTADPMKNARRRAGELASMGCVGCFPARVRPPLELNGPLARWKPSDPVPDLKRVSSRLIRRWTAPAEAAVLVTATLRSGRWLDGDGGRRPRRTEGSHDLTVAGVYLNWRRQAPAGAEWISETRLRRQGFGDESRLPDAMVVVNGARTVIEIGGAYSTRKLEEFHEFCWNEELPYEIW